MRCRSRADHANKHDGSLHKNYPNGLNAPYLVHFVCYYAYTKSQYIRHQHIFWAHARDGRGSRPFFMYKAPNSLHLHIEWEITDVIGRLL